MRSEGRPARLGRAGSVTLIAVIVVAAAIIAYRVAAAVATGPEWDTYAFLANAAEFAGKGYGYTELHRPPFISLITAGAFLAGAPLHESVIQWVDGAFTLAGVVAFYLIARRRFRPLLSGVGAVALLALAPVWEWLGSGYTDFPSVALCLWVLWFCIKATEDDPRWFLAAGPLFIAATLTRYTSLLAVFPIGVWFVLRARPFHQARQIGGALLLALVAYLPAARLYWTRFGDALFPFIIALTMSEDVAAPVGAAPVEASVGWYVRHLPGFLTGDRIGALGATVLLVAGLGILLGVGTHFSVHRPRASRVALAILACVPALLAQAAGGMILRQVTIPIAIVGLYRALAPYEEDAKGRRVTTPSALVATMATWLLAYVDFHGHQNLQLTRYVIPMAPGLIFLVLYGWQTFVVDIRRTLTSQEDRAEDRALRPLLRFAAPIVLGGVFAIALGVNIAGAPGRPVSAVTLAKESAAWLTTERDTTDSVIFSDVWPLTAWYMRRNITAMETFSEDAARQHALDTSAVDYYVTITSRAYDGFARVAAGDEWRVLERTSPAPTDLPRVGYLGKAWDNYLESVTEYTFYLEGTAGRFGWEGSAFFDSVPADELRRYPVVACYDMRWRDRYAGEAALEEYLESGGVIVIDASSNLGTLPYDLANTVMFDTVIRRATLPADATIEVRPSFAERYPGLASVDAAPFVDEDGGTWAGAEYVPLPGRADLEVLATVGGEPLVALRRVGSGRVYWIGYNFVWHAFMTQNADEQALVRAVFAEAFDSEGSLP